MTKNAMKDDVKIVGYVPGAIGKIIEQHAVYFSKRFGFDYTFEVEIAHYLVGFMRHFQNYRDGLWVAISGKTVVGSVVIDGRNQQSEGIRLRLFLVDPNYHGQGIGRRLLQKAIDFCKSNGYEKIILWTFDGLAAARYLYLQFGFQLKEEREVDYWGCQLIEQKYELLLSADDS